MVTRNLKINVMHVRFCVVLSVVFPLAKLSCECVMWYLLG